MFLNLRYSALVSSLVLFIAIQCQSIETIGKSNATEPIFLLRSLVGSKSKSIIYSYQDGLHQNQFGALGKTTEVHRFKIGSVTKVFTAIAILQLEDQGRLSLDDPMVRYLPELKSIRKQNPKSRDFTIRDVLTHKSGLPSDLSHEFFLPPETDSETIYKKRNEIFSHLSNSELVTPGNQTSYSNLGFSLLGLVIERVSKMELEDYFQKNIFQKSGMRNSSLLDGISNIPLVKGYHGILFSTETSIPKLRDLSAGSMSTTAEDMSLLFKAFFKSKQGKGGLLSQKSFWEMHRIQKKAPFDFEFTFGLTVMANQYLSAGKTIQVFSHSGSLPPYAAHWIYEPNSEISVFIAGNQFPYHIQEIPEVAEKIFQSLWLSRFHSPLLVKKNSDNTKQSLFVPGVYASSQGVIEIKEQDGQKELLFSGVPLVLVFDNGQYRPFFKAFFGMLDLTPKSLEDLRIEMETHEGESIVSLSSNQFPKGIAGVGIKIEPNKSQVNPHFYGSYTNPEKYAIIPRLKIFYEEPGFQKVTVTYRLAGMDSDVTYLCSQLENGDLRILGRGRNLQERIALRNQNGLVSVLYSGISFVKK